MPEAVGEFAAKELAAVLGETRAAAGDMLSLAHELEVNLPGTKAAFRDGIVGRAQGRDHRVGHRRAGPGPGPGR